MTAIVLMTHLNSSNELINHFDELFFRYGMTLLIDGHFEFSNRLCILSLGVLDAQRASRTPRDKIWVNAEATRVRGASWSAD